MTPSEFAPIDEAVRKAVASQGFMQLVGAKIDTLAPGKAVMSLERRAEVLQQHGFFHGGAVAFLVDNATTIAAGTTIDRHTHTCLTAEYKLNFVSPGRGERLVCEATVLKPGRRLAVVEAKVYSHEGDRATLTAVALATIAVIERQAVA
jgi:uncharacterized protein (TIGR00369 family)